MKYRLTGICLALSLFSLAPAHAGFFIPKNTAVNSVQPVQASTASAPTASSVTYSNDLQISDPFSRGTNFPRPYHRHHAKNQWYGIVALGCGLLGLIFPGLNFAAILFGVLGIGRKSEAKGLAIAGLVLGLLELAIFLIAGTVFVSLILL